MQMELVVRFDYGLIVPWVRSFNGMLTAMAGPDAVCLRADVDFRHERQTITAEFTVSAGQRLWFVLASYASSMNRRHRPWIRRKPSRRRSNGGETGRIGARIAALGNNK